MKNNSFTLWKASDNSQFIHTSRVRPPKVKLGQWRSRSSGSPTASNTWRKDLVTKPWRWAGKRLKESFKPDTNSPYLEMQLDDNSNYLTTVIKDLDINRDTPGAVEPFTNLFLNAARANYTRKPKAPINPNKTTINADAFPRDNGALRHTKRWNLTRRPSPMLLRALKTDNTSFMACICSNTRISTPVEPQTSTMEIYSDKVHGRGTSNSGRGIIERSQSQGQTTNTRSNHLCRCFRLRLRSKFSFSPNSRFLVRRRKRRQHKCSRVENHPVCTAGSSYTVQELEPADILRQYDGIEVCEQGRGNIVRDSSRTSDSNSENLQQLQRAIGLSSRSWNSKYNGKSPQQKEGTFVRMDVTMGMDQP